jgi:hypothetical protein
VDAVFSWSGAWRASRYGRASPSTASAQPRAGARQTGRTRGRVASDCRALNWNRAGLLLRPGTRPSHRRVTWSPSSSGTAAGWSTRSLPTRSRRRVFLPPIPNSLVASYPRRWTSVAATDPRSGRGHAVHDEDKRIRHSACCPSPAYRWPMTSQSAARRGALERSTSALGSHEASNRGGARVSALRPCRVRRSPTATRSAVTDLLNDSNARRQRLSA